MPLQRDYAQGPRCLHPHLMPVPPCRRPAASPRTSLQPLLADDGELVHVPLEQPAAVPNVQDGEHAVQPQHIGPGLDVSGGQAHELGLQEEGGRGTGGHAGMQTEWVSWSGFFEQPVSIKQCLYR